MAQGKRPREVEKSKLILSMNWKEEMLLQKRLSLLDSLKRQVADSYTLDQRILYNRFRSKLRRSELAQARLMGRRELVEQLKVNSFSGFNTTVTDDSKAAVREILQGAPSASARYRRLEGALTPSSQKDAEGACRGAGAAEGEVDSAQPRFPAARPHTTTLITPPGLDSGCPRHRPYTAPGLSVGPRGNDTKPGREGGAGVQAVTLDSDADGSEQRKGAPQPVKSKKSSSFSGAGAMKQHSPLHLFLNVGQRRAKPSLLEVHACLTREFRLEEETRGFVEAVQTGQQRSRRACDYYSERLLATLARSGSKARLSGELDKDTAGWEFVGKELNYRSITFKKLDWSFPPDVLLSGSCEEVKETSQQRPQSSHP